MNNAPVPIDTLLAHRAWVRGFARSLVRDDARADDLEQQAWVAALERPPERGDSPRGWLATVLRRAAGKERRSEGRRDGRERAAARPEPVPAVDDLAAHAEILERIVRAALDLEEPYRSAILLRFFEGLEPGEIARRTGTPVETVRSRLRRALERLRGRFDREHGGDRKAWVALLLPIAASPAGPDGPSGGGAASAAAGGALAMSAKSAVAAAVLLLAVVAGWILFRGEESGGGGSAVADATPVVPGGAGIGSGDAPAAASPEGIPAPVEAADPPPSPLPPPGGLRLLLLAADGAPPPAEEARLLLDGSRVFLVRSSAMAMQGLDAYVTTALDLTTDWRKPHRVAFDGTGPYLDPPAEEGRWRLFVSAKGRAPRMGEDLDVPASGETSAEIRLPAPTETLRVRALDAATKAPLPGARFTPHFEFGDDQVFLPGLPVLADEGGEAELPLPADVMLTRAPTWWIEAPGRAAPVFETRPPGKRTGTLEVEVPATARIEGSAWLASGLPAVGCTVIGGRKGFHFRAEVDGEGRYSLDGVPAAGVYAKWSLFLVESPSPLRVSTKEVRLKPGETATLNFGEAYETGTRATLLGRVTAGGVPLPGVSIIVKGGDGRADGPARMGTTDAEGRYRIDGIPAGAGSVFVWTGGLADDWGVRSAAPRTFTAGEEILADFDLPGGRLRVRILDASTGKPIRGAGAGARPADKSVEVDRFPGWTFRAGQARFAGEDGTVLLVGLPPGAAHELEVMAPGYKAAPKKTEGVSPAEGDPAPEVVVHLEPAAK